MIIPNTKTRNAFLWKLRIQILKKNENQIQDPGCKKAEDSKNQNPNPAYAVISDDGWKTNTLKPRSKLFLERKTPLKKLKIPGRS